MPPWGYHVCIVTTINATYVAIDSTRFQNFTWIKTCGWHRALVLKAKNRLTMTFFHSETTRETLGIEQFALPYWVASNPTVEPCDLASSSLATQLSHSNSHDHGFGFWTADQLLSSTNAAATSKRHLLRRLPESPNYNATLDTMIRNDASLRTREWCFFAGHALRWGVIYNETAPPPPSSFDASSGCWIWNQGSLLPDAEEWRAAIQQYGYHGAVDFMTRPFANTKV
jgi:hypothetical protein